MILGLDMATKKTGYAILTNKGDLVQYGVIRSESKEVKDRIKEIYFGIENILKENKITHVVLEDVPVNNHSNLKTGKDLCILQGSILACCFHHKLDYTFYNPSAWRSLIGTYDGTKAGMKRDIQKQKAIEYVNNKFDLDFKYFARETKKNITDDDKAEAICIALAYINSKKGG